VTSSVTMVTKVVTTGKVMRTIKASEFKAKCLALMDTVATTGETLVVTKNGKPVAELRPYSSGRIDSPFGLHPALEIHGDVVAPLDETLWKALG
jgi:prevent-host-death family protein